MLFVSSAISRMTATKSYTVLMLAPTPYFSDRGCHVRIYEEARELIKAGHQVVVVSYPLGRSLEPVPVERSVPVPWYTKREAGPSWHKPYLDLLLLIKAWGVARRLKPDIIHAHLHEGALIGWVLSRCSGVPLVFDYQGSLSGESLNHGFYRPGSVLHRGFRALERLINRLADLVVTSSSNGVVEVQSSSPQIPVYALPDGVDTQTFSPQERGSIRQELGLAPDLPTVVFIGLLNQYQGVDFLLDVLVDLLQSRPPFQVLIMGFPEAPYRELVRQRGLSDMIHVTGRVSYADVPRYLAAGDVAVAPKLTTTEANGKVLNYMACGLPVVAFDTEVNRELLGDDGIYVPLGNRAAFGQAIASLLANLPQAAAHGNRLRERAVRTLSWHARIATLVGYYERLVKVK